MGRTVRTTVLVIIAVYAIAHVLLGAHHLWQPSSPDLLWANHQLIASPMRLSHTPSSWRE